ncbi:hypothetical protein C5167_040228 [Papaver somniferum]|uniref:Uncharacterized protein n=1 Tax=Papaver somniferum TaxID=3469 RepID=A0A4Y7IEA5_PAPSO|nr:hypothetical protein C5167_040228 [Papaver somniferum]
MVEISQGHYKKNLETFRCSTALYIGVFGRTTPAFRKIKESIESATTNESPPVVTNRRTKRILPTTARKIRKSS